jgi:hypothetical protein
MPSLKNNFVLYIRKTKSFTTTEKGFHKNLMINSSRTDLVLYIRDDGDKKKLNQWG